MNELRRYSPIDEALMVFDQGLRMLTGQQAPSRKTPGHRLAETDLSAQDKRLSANLMRVDHAGEVAAQGLYHGQAVSARTAGLRQHMQAAALDEGDHLLWCQQRIDELGSHVSYLTPFWYGGSFCIGLLAGMMGNAWSLGFVVETEYQVEQHLSEHLQRLPEGDHKSQIILQQMQQDEIRHGAEAQQQQARELPLVIKWCMKASAKVMTTVAFWL